VTASTAARGRPAIFLDRDGVLNEPVWRAEEGVHESPLSPNEVELVLRAAEAIRLAHEAGWTLVLASNQPAAAKGTVPLEQLRAVNDEVLRLLDGEGASLDGVYVCWHHPDGSVPGLTLSCECRKPRPGLLLTAADELGLDLASSWLVGDTDADVGAARNAGLAGVALVRNPRSAHRRGRLSETADLSAIDTVGAVEAILDRHQGSASKG
jgi:D-glycero-D-manno-heptose 1,7-bisphosphate phosphatase